MAHLEDIDALKWGAVKWGSFVSAVIKFVIIAFILFLIVKFFKSLGEKTVTTGPPEPTSSEKLLAQILDELKKRPGAQTVRLNNAPPVAGPPGWQHFL